MGGTACCESSHDQKAASCVKDLDTLPVIVYMHEEGTVQGDKIDEQLDTLVTELAFDKGGNCEVTSVPTVSSHNSDRSVHRGGSKRTDFEDSSNLTFSYDPAVAPSEAESVKEEAAEFMVTLHRRESLTRVGLGIYNRIGEPCLRIREVHSGWLAHAHNLAHPTKLLKPGDAIVEVNGVRHANAMRRLFEDLDQEVLSFRVRPALNSLSSRSEKSDKS
mmetsp:Transcript_44953/g.82122  ORF Transcript_44953/g.82122 Transcript_44953/m.82122 type:complete len:218 (-) Transcript_44953:48-701(-)